MIAAILLVLSLAAALTSVIDAGFVGMLVILAFLMLAPGWLVAVRLDLGEAALVWSVSVGIGVSIAVLLAAGMVVAGLWYPSGSVVALAVLTSIGLIGHVR